MRRSGGGGPAKGLAVAKHDGVQVDPVVVNQAKLGEASRQIRAGDLDLLVLLGLQLLE
jgi:hypothetical protein